jgi:D-alanine-D-alanine ligase
MVQHGVPTAPYLLARSRADARNCALPFPLFAKPAFEGSGKGVTVKSLCHHRAELVERVDELLATYNQPVLVEAWLPGLEFTVPVIGNGGEARCLPIVGMRFDTLPPGAPPIYGYEAKWLWDTLDQPLDIDECPASIPDDLADQVRSAALSAYHALDCRDWCRIDVRCDAAGRPMVVELNPLPGILPDPRDNSCFPKAARVAGMEYDDLIRTVADLAWRRISGRSLLAGAAAWRSPSSTTPAATTGRPGTWPRGATTSAKCGTSSGCAVMRWTPWPSASGISAGSPARAVPTSW